MDVRTTVEVDVGVRTGTGTALTAASKAATDSMFWQIMMFENVECAGCCYRSEAKVKYHHGHHSHDR